MTGTFYVTGLKSKLATSRTGKAFQVWDVYLTRRIGEPWSDVVTTTKGLYASIAKIAYEHGKTIQIGAKQSRFGWELVTVEMETRESANV